MRGWYVPHAGYGAWLYGFETGNAVVITSDSRLLLEWFTGTELTYPKGLLASPQGAVQFELQPWT